MYSQLEGHLEATWSRMASTRRNHLSSTYFSHSSSRMTKECCHDGCSSQRERKQKSFSRLCVHQVFFLTKQTGSLMKETAKSCSKGHIYSDRKNQTIKAIELTQKQAALAFLLFQQHTYCSRLWSQLSHDWFPRRAFTM